MAAAHAGIAGRDADAAWRIALREQLGVEVEDR